jgi:hypothetical protein
MNLDEVLKRLTAMPEEERLRVIEEAHAASQGMRWIPSPGPQTEAYFSKADILLYGGEPGGGKTSLLLGLAFNCHRRSLIMRKQYTDLGAIVEEAVKFNGSRKGYNGSPPPSLRISPEKFIEFGAAARVGDEEHWQGNPHDFIGFDEGTQFAEIQIRFLMGWLRCADDPNQRTRVVIATNPPLSSEGAWVVQMFAPWLDPRHHNPARIGELRYFVTDEYGKDKEVPGPEPFELANGQFMRPLSRTFIPASVNDNPYLANTNYQSQLDAMVEPFRSILMGGFMASFRDDDKQCIPTMWVREAQRRWTQRPKLGIPMCAIGTDVAQGGTDNTVLAPRYDDWFAPLIEKPGRETPLGSDVAGMILAHRRDGAVIVLDMGGGYGGATYEHLLANDIPVIPYKGATGVETRTKDRQLKFTNKRTEAYWRFREALDPSQDGGSTIMLPDDPVLMADLTAPTFEITKQGIKLETKEDLVKRLGRSPDRGDAVIMAWSAGPKFMADGGEWITRRDNLVRGSQANKVIMGRNAKR